MVLPRLRLTVQLFGDDTGCATVGNGGGRFAEDLPSWRDQVFCGPWTAGS